jgi:hypothetical protein
MHMLLLRLLEMIERWRVCPRPPLRLMLPQLLVRVVPYPGRAVLYA